MNPNAASAIVLGDGQEYFVYYGREDEIIPPDVTHVMVHPSVRTIRYGAFWGRGRLSIAILNDGLEEIGTMAFAECASLRRIVIPDTVGTIKDEAFYRCSGLTTVTLGSGLKEIGGYAFYRCTSLQRIEIPNAVKMIKDRAFLFCFGLTAVTLGEGLEVIGHEAFGYCTSLVRIVIPPDVKLIDDTAFINCTRTNVKFGKEIEEFVSNGSMWDWHQGARKKYLRMWCFLVRRSVPERFSCLATVSTWQVNIYDMLRNIPTISAMMNSYFDAIDSKLTVYENLLTDAPMMFPEQFGLYDELVLYILSFL